MASVFGADQAIDYVAGNEGRGWKRESVSATLRSLGLELSVIVRSLIAP